MEEYLAINHMQRKLSTANPIHGALLAVAQVANENAKLLLTNPSAAQTISGQNLTLAADLAINGGDLTTSATTFNLLNATATTVNFAGAATTLAIGAATGTATIKNASVVLDGDLQVKGGDVTTTATTFNLLNATATTVNFAGAATALTLGAATGTTTIKNASVVLDGDLAVNGGDLTTSATTFNLLASPTTINLGAAATTFNVGAAAGTVTVAGDLTVSGGDISSTRLNKITVTAPAAGATLTLADGSTLATSGAFSTTLTATAATNVTLPTTGTLATLAGTETFTNKTLTSPSVGTSLTTASTSFDLLNTTATTVNFAGAATTLNVADDATAAQTVNLATGATLSGSTKTVNIGTNSAAGSTTNVNLGAASGTSTVTVNGKLVLGAAAQATTTATISTTGATVIGSFASTEGGTAEFLVAASQATPGGRLLTKVLVVLHGLTVNMVEYGRVEAGTAIPFVLSAALNGPTVELSATVNNGNTNNVTTEVLRTVL